MEISQLQSIIKRQSDTIAHLEDAISGFFGYAKRCRIAERYAVADEASMEARLLKRKLKKLVSLQKALKKEIALEIRASAYADIYDDNEPPSFSGLPTWLLGQAQ